MSIFRDMGYGMGPILVMTAFISFLGFLLENIWLTARKGYMDNRNMYAPFLLGYGIAVMGFYTVLGTPGNLRIFGAPSESGEKSQFAAYFILTFILVSAGEIILGKTVEKITHIVLWDYTKIPLHITRYTSVPTSFGFTVVIVVFMDCFFERIMNALSRMEPVRVTVFGIILMTVTVLDFLHSAVKMTRTHKMFVTWEIDFREKSFRLYRQNEE
ncbi:MAG: putative ABC transporter permease [Eubacterium sp.]|nr:putative ABC transporter permease [Eubacterium sp.]